MIIEKKTEQTAKTTPLLLSSLHKYGNTAPDADPTPPDSDNVQGVQGDVPSPVTAPCGAPANVVI